jgi:S-DNA-T family DNA segregation ATPase FtsK/SpoIIIE
MAILILIIISIVILILIKKLDNKIKDIGLKTDFFDQKLDSENEKILTTMNQQYTDVMTNLRSINGKIDFKETIQDVELYEQAKTLIEETRICSASFLQRTFRIGYARAAQLIDMLEKNGLVSPADGVNPREYIGDKEDSE